MLWRKPGLDLGKYGKVAIESPTRCIKPSPTSWSRITRWWARPVPGCSTRVSRLPTC
jgi:hypothetical protein